MTAIKTHNLTKTFGRGKESVHALKDINLEVPTGKVFGFLGPNGAGKTTTIRVLMNLVHPTYGQAYIFGEDVQGDSRVFKKVGAMVENPAFYGYMNGRDNLAVLARTAGMFDLERIDGLLEEVGLGRSAHRPVKGYSLGMKQRLGIAAALLSSPELVLLDEPTNGLDPAGIQEMRRFIRGLAENEGKTVFICSHLLYEVEQVCDQVAIINKGEIIQQGTVNELLDGEHADLRLLVTPRQRAYDLLAGKYHLEMKNDWMTTSLPPDEVPVLVEFLVSNGIEIHQVIQKQQSLEEYFMTVTQEDGGND
ncbi:MAG: ABC transporter ATP-binding protein [Anaerolineae bacterium]|nr:ABC transporter ATP-binding protein [Anaerolineae bacterium]